MNDDKAKSDPRTQFTSDSSCNYFFEHERDTSILSEFGWNLHDEEADRRFDDAVVDDRYGLPENLMVSPAATDSTDYRSSEPVAQVGSVNKSCRDATTSNPSVSSSSDEDMPEKSSGSGVNPPAEIASKVKKKGQKRIRQQRFAFMTKSEVDNLEDGYRWRKYGQKAVKNSTFPRNYYRCTNSKCTVKKRVERSDQDPSTVITTYEGQHCHHTVGFHRGGLLTHESVFSPQLGSPALCFNPESSHNQVPREAADVHGLAQPQLQPQPHPQPTSQLHTDEGLLDDIVSPRTRNR